MRQKKETPSKLWMFQRKHGYNDRNHVIKTSQFKNWKKAPFIPINENMKKITLSLPKAIYMRKE